MKNSRTWDAEKTRKLTLAAMLTAVVVVLTLLGVSIKLGPFGINLALVPIVIGAAKLGVLYGGWFGLVNAIVILLSGDAGLFLSFNVPGTIITVLCKGILSGLCAGWVYHFVSKYNRYAAVILAAIVCPIVNTGIFLVGCRLFFWKNISSMGAEMGKSPVAFTFGVLIGTNFIVEFAVNAILAPAIAIVLGIPQDKNTALIVYGATLTIVGFGFLIFALVKLFTEGKGQDLFAYRDMLQQLNAKQRFSLAALFADICRLSGLGLMVSGVTRKKTIAKAQNEMKKLK